MAASDALFRLINTMDQHEKRHFKLSANSGLAAEQKNYLELFDLLNGMKQYDEAELKKRLSNATFAKNLSAGKNYLYGLLLKSLRQYNTRSANRTAQIMLAEHWIDIHILLDKGLFKQAQKIIARAKKMCRKYHFDLDLLKINRFEREIKNNYVRKNSIAGMLELQEESAQLMRATRMNLASFTKYETVFTHVKNKDSEELINAAIARGEKYFEQLKTESDQLPIWTFVNFHNLRVHQLQFQRDYEGRAHHLSIIIDLFNQDEKVKNEYQDRYLKTLNNYFNSCLQARQLEALPPLQEKLKSIKPRNTRNKAKIAQHTYYYQMLYHLTKEEYEKVIELAPEIEKCLSQFDKFLSINRKLTFIYNVGVAYFLEAIKHHKQKVKYQALFNHALDWLNKIENEPKFESRKDVKRFTKTLMAIIYFDLEVYQLVESKLNIGIRYLKKENRFNSGEGLIFKTLQKVLSAKNKKEKEQLYRQLHEDLKEYSGMEELRKWVDTKYSLAEK